LCILLCFPTPTSCSIPLLLYPIFLPLLTTSLPHPGLLSPCSLETISSSNATQTMFWSRLTLYLFGFPICFAAELNYSTKFWILACINTITGACGSVVVKALCYMGSMPAEVIF
jgi:hypothetical protein